MRGLRRVRVVLAFAVGMLALAFAVGAPTASADVGWCGSGEADANRVPDAVAGPLVHVVYAYPSDGTDNFGSVASTIASIVDRIDSWWRTQDPARTPRFDLYPFPGCSGPGSLDISVVRLESSSADLTPYDGRADLIAASLRTFMTQTWVKPMVFYDGPIDAGDDSGQVCGEASGAFDSAIGSFGVVYLRSTCMQSIGEDAAVTAHELVHELGAVAAGAPHFCDQGHVCDSLQDLMWPYDMGSQIESLTLDVGRDDYYRDGGGGDISGSAWLRRLDAPQQPLSLTIRGGGIVTASLPGLACSADCQTQWDQGSSVWLSANADQGQRFVGWKGGCSGQSCQVTLDAPVAVQAVFAPIRSAPGPRSTSHSAARAALVVHSLYVGIAHPGQGLKVLLDVVRSGDGQPVSSARISCSASTGGRKLPVLIARLVSGVPTCSFAVPRGASGEIDGRISVSAPGLAGVVEHFRARIR